MIYTCGIGTRLGFMTAAAENGHITGLWFAGQKYFPHGSSAWADSSDYPVFVQLRIWLGRYFAGENPTMNLPLDLRGTTFQKEVWRFLSEIPYGSTSSYGEISKQLAAGRNLASMSAQAVGSAVGHNPISLLIPCHRVVGCAGQLTGYAGGLDKKEFLLELEKIYN